MPSVPSKLSSRASGITTDRRAVSSKSCETGICPTALASAVGPSVTWNPSAPARNVARASTGQGRHTRAGPRISASSLENRATPAFSSKVNQQGLGSASASPSTCGLNPPPIMPERMAPALPLAFMIAHFPTNRKYIATNRYLLPVNLPLFWQSKAVSEGRSGCSKRTTLLTGGKSRPAQAPRSNVAARYPMQLSRARQQAGLMRRAMQLGLLLRLFRNGRRLPPVIVLQSWNARQR